MENKKIDTTFGLAVIVFLIGALFVLGGLRKIHSDKKSYELTMSNLLQRKNDKIKVLAAQLAAKQKELDGLQRAVTNAKSDLETVPVVPAPVAPAPVAK